MLGIGEYLRQDKAYFRDCGDAVTARNRRMLVDGCIVYACVLAFYTLMSVAMGATTLLRLMYYAFDFVHVLLCAAVFAFHGRRDTNRRTTQRLCAALEISILSFFALEGAFVSTTQHSLYIPIAILLVLLVFEHSAAYYAALIPGYCGVFALCSCLYKTRAAATNDMYIAAATLISAGIGYVLITKLHRSEQLALAKYEALSRTDGLTGLNNKATLTRLCESAVAIAPVALTILDLDDFKAINDRYGHMVGDEALTAVGGAMKRVFADGAIIGRFGGDEFVALLTDAGEEAVHARVDELRRLVGGASLSEKELRVRFSVGIAYSRPGEDFASLFARADRALYEAKRAGKDRLATDDAAPARS